MLDNVGYFILEIFEDNEAGTPEDKMRLFLIYYLCTPNISDSQIDEYAKTLQVKYCRYVVKVSSCSNMDIMKIIFS